MEGTPYREGEDRLGAEERDAEACRMLGKWRDRVRARILLVAALIGLVGGGIVIYGATLLQFQINNGLSSLRISIVAASIFFVAAMLAGRLIGRVTVLRRMDAKVDELAKLYEIPRAPLAATADLLRGL
jgi:hypothetical protein